METALAALGLLLVLGKKPGSTQPQKKEEPQQPNGGQTQPSADLGTGGGGGGAPNVGAIVGTVTSVAGTVVGLVTKLGIGGAATGAATIGSTTAATTGTATATATTASAGTATAGASSTAINTTLMVSGSVAAGEILGAFAAIILTYWFAGGAQMVTYLIGGAMAEGKLFTSRFARFNTNCLWYLYAFEQEWLDNVAQALQWRAPPGGSVPFVRLTNEQKVSDARLQKSSSSNLGGPVPGTQTLGGERTVWRYTRPLNQLRVKGEQPEWTELQRLARLISYQYAVRLAEAGRFFATRRTGKSGAPNCAKTLGAPQGTVWYEVADSVLVEDVTGFEALWNFPLAGGGNAGSYAEVEAKVYANPKFKRLVYFARAQAIATAASAAYQGGYRAEQLWSDLGIAPDDEVIAKGEEEFVFWGANYGFQPEAPLTYNMRTQQWGGKPQWYPPTPQEAEMNTYGDSGYGTAGYAQRLLVGGGYDSL